MPCVASPLSRLSDRDSCLCYCLTVLAPELEAQVEGRRPGRWGLTHSEAGYSREGRACSCWTGRDSAAVA